MIQQPHPLLTMNTTSVAVLAESHSPASVHSQPRTLHRDGRESEKPDIRGRWQVRAEDRACSGAVVPGMGTGRGWG